MKAVAPLQGSMIEAAPPIATLRFGRFCFDPVRRLLTAGGAPVTLSARGFDLLHVLIDGRHRVMPFDELRRLVWRGQAVDDNNLAVQVAALRRALAEPLGAPRIILTVPGRGYQFVAEIEADADPGPAMMSTPVVAPVVTPGATRRDIHARRATVTVLAAVALVAVASAALLTRVPGAAASRLSIAVLPFRNLSGTPAEDPFADAISDDLTTVLAHIPASTVIARTSADAFRGRAVAAAEIGRMLHVRYLLEGSLRREGSRYHINAQLIDAASGRHLWARAFDVERDELGEARSTIVGNIASALDIRLADVAAEPSPFDRHSEPDATDLFLRARSVLSRGTTLADLAEAQGLLERATAAAPDFAEAASALGLVLIRKIAEFDDPARAADYAAAKRVTARALTLAPHDETATTAAGLLDWVDGRYEAAAARFRLVLAANSNDVLAGTGLAMCARRLGRLDEMAAELRTLMRIDPASAANARRQHSMGMVYLMQGNPREALVWLDRAGASSDVETRPEQKLIDWREWRVIYHIAATELAGNHAGAVREYENYAKNKPRRTVWRLATFYGRAQRALPGNAAVQGALHRAGMPDYMPEDADFGIAADGVPHQGGLFDATPLAVPGLRRITTSDLQALLAGARRPVVLDYGSGSAVILGARWVSSFDGPLLDAAGLDQRVAAALAEAAATRDVPVVVMSDGPCGWDSYNGALRLVAEGFRSVLWYRGGQEAWSAAGLPSENRRPD